MRSARRRGTAHASTPTVSITAIVRPTTANGCAPGACSPDLLRRRGRRRADGRDRPLPARRLHLEADAPGAGQPVVLGAPVVLRDAPLARDLAVVLQPRQRRVQRALLHLQLLARDLLEPQQDPVAVQLAE